MSSQGTPIQIAVLDAQRFYDMVEWALQYKEGPFKDAPLTDLDDLCRFTQRHINSISGNFMSERDKWKTQEVYNQLSPDARALVPPSVSQFYHYSQKVQELFDQEKAKGLIHVHLGVDPFRTTPINTEELAKEIIDMMEAPTIPGPDLDGGDETITVSRKDFEAAMSRPPIPPEILKERMTKFLDKLRKATFDETTTQASS